MPLLQITLLLVVPDRSAGSNAEYRFVPLAIEDELSQVGGHEKPSGWCSSSNSAGLTTKKDKLSWMGGPLMVGGRGG